MPVGIRPELLLVHSSCSVVAGHSYCATQVSSEPSDVRKADPPSWNRQFLRSSRPLTASYESGLLTRCDPNGWA